MDKLNERFIGNLSEDEIAFFYEEAVTLFAEREPVKSYNE